MLGTQFAAEEFSCAEHAAEPDGHNNNVAARIQARDEVKLAFHAVTYLGLQLLCVMCCSAKTAMFSK